MAHIQTVMHKSARNARMLKCTNAQMHKCTNAQMLKCSNAQMLNCSTAQPLLQQMLKDIHAQRHACSKTCMLNRFYNECSKTDRHTHVAIGWVGNIKILKHAQFLCQFYELRKLNTRTGVEGYGFVAWLSIHIHCFSFLVSLFFLVLPYHTNSL